MTVRTATLLLVFVLLLAVVVNAWVQSTSCAKRRSSSSRLRVSSRDEQQEDEANYLQIALFRRVLESAFVDEDHQDDGLMTIESHDKDGWDSYCTTEDCEQCEIPDEFKILPSVPKDIMSFLGIRRAEPLRVRRDWE